MPRAVKQIAYGRDAVVARAGRAGGFGAERVEQLPRHDVVAVLVDAADDLAERLRLPDERRRRVGR